MLSGLKRDGKCTYHKMVEAIPRLLYACNDIVNTAVARLMERFSRTRRRNIAGCRESNVGG